MEDSRIPATFILMMFAQFLLIVVEFVIYVRKNILAKIVLHYVALVAVHFFLLFYLPIRNNRTFIQSSPLVVFYLLQVLYLGLSGFQISHGYRMFSSRKALTNFDNPGYVRKFVYLGYR